MSPSSSPTTTKESDADLTLLARSQAFSPDSRWIIVTSQDSVIRTFDVPTGQLVDAFRTKAVATSLSFSPTGDFLATTHVDSVGIYLWANRAQFSEVSLLTFVEEDGIEDVALPTVQGLSGDESAFSFLSCFTVFHGLIFFHLPRSPLGPQRPLPVGGYPTLHHPGPALLLPPHSLPHAPIALANPPEPRHDQSEEQDQGGAEAAGTGSVLPPYSARDGEQV